ncbi:fluoride efflux transporter CrcB [Flavobacterium sp. LMO8]|uniref:fluoride efflux transporter CrcB n=1 Tax=Flavobacterium sp. LMO8 TaxID=2654244 RepID=UPI00129283A0|nr:fluoride efflux transporter CrcB [Flavobacterium sp. LMO8]MQP25885.1 fluoride efflux transporter CrcB [Flavobacterium sp. LMO8]
MLKTILLVGIGGAIGSIFRYVTHWATTKYFQGSFPLSTFLVNILGSLLIGLFIGYLGKHFPENHPLKFLLIVGFCGGFTTFSSFALENYNLLQNNQQITAYIYMASSIILTISAVGLGSYLAKYL